MKILGIETSCDETAAAVVQDGSIILSSIVSSQVEVHHPYGGVVPELASRKHIEAIGFVTRQALQAAGLHQRDLDAVAVTQGPGLVGALLVGFCFSRAFAYALNIPWVCVDHLAGHLHSVFFQKPVPKFPFIGLLVSGGHTGIYEVLSHTQAECLGQTLDDAAGEAFDKTAKLLGLGYPGGPVISQLSEKGDPERIQFPRAYLDRNAYDFSFSGIKTAVSRYVQTHSNEYRDRIEDIAAGFQEAVVEVLVYKALHAAAEKGHSRIAVVGGVSANRRLRERMREEASQRGIAVFIPAAELCGDNAAMIAAAGYHYLKKNGPSKDWLQKDVYSRAASPAP